MCVNATQQGRCIRVPSTKRIRKELPYPRLRVGRRSVHAKNLATLPIWRENPNFHRPEEFEIFLHPERVKHEVKKVFRIGEGLRRRYPIPPWKRKCALSRKTTHSSALIMRKVRVQKYFEHANIAVVIEGVIAQLARLTVQATLR